MAIINTSKPTTSITNTTNRVVSYETWDTNISTWNSETRTWDQMGTTWSNTSKPVTSIINISK